MAQLKYGSAGVSAVEIDQTTPTAPQPVGVPAGIIGTALKGPAYVPVTVANTSDFYSQFGLTDGIKFGPLAATEWLRNSQALTYLRVLGCGDGQQRSTETGDVNYGGFTVGENEPNLDNSGILGPNPNANLGGPPGRTYFLGCFMSESAGSTIFSSTGLQTGSNAQPIIRGVLTAASGVVMTLSSSVFPSLPPAATTIGSDSNGSCYGSTVLLQNTIAKQDFVLLLNGHMGTNPLYPNVITASFDMTSPNYFANVLNGDPTLINDAGHYLYANWDIYPVTAAVTGTGVISPLSGSGAATATVAGAERVAFLLTGALARDVGSSTVPDFEDFRDRFSAPATPWVISQPFGGKPQNLFKVYALDDGTGISTIYKLSIENIAPSTDPTNLYPSFDLCVRSWTDNDSAPVYLEQWRGINLDPSDSRYICKVIGDQNTYFDFDRGPTAQKIVVDGNYANASNYIRIEVDPSVDNAETDPTAMPVGVRGISHLMTMGTAPLAHPTGGGVVDASTWNRVVQPPLPLRQNITQGSGAKVQVNPLLYWGTQFEHVVNLSTPNLSTLPNKSLQSFADFFPTHRIDIVNFATTDNAGTMATTANGVIDNDDFNTNVFSLMNVQVVTNSAGVADPTQWASAVYVRNGNIPTNNTTATRALNTSDFIQANRRFLKWTFFAQGGFDGTNPFDQDEAYLDNAAVEADMIDPNRGLSSGPTVSAYLTALNIMGEVTNTDLQILTVPGIRNPVVTDAAINAVETRFDSLYLMDIEEYDGNGDLVVSSTQTPSVANTAAVFSDRSLNSSFGAAYFPDVVMPDPNTGTNVVVPPSVVVLGAIALNDAVGHPWFAPAGFTRGALSTTLEAVVQLSKANMDVLYDVNVNPLVAFPGNSSSGGTNPKGGVVVWGQKTLQQAATALDRVNVRRLLIEIRRQVRDIAMTIIFEPNQAATLAKFSAAVNPVLQKIQAQSGLTAFKVQIDTSTTTQQDIDNNTIRGRIYVQPTKSVEYVSINFAVSNNIPTQG